MKNKSVLIIVVFLLFFSQIKLNVYAIELDLTQETSVTSYIEDGVRIDHQKPNFSNDVKKVEIKESHYKYTDYPWGFSLTIPSNLKINLDCNGAFTRFFSDNLDIKVSKEYSPYLDVDWYFENYSNKYILNQTYRENNNIELLYNKTKYFGNYETKLVAFRRNTENKNTLNEYLLAYIKVGGLVYYNMFIKSNDLKANEQVINKILNSFKSFNPAGKIKYNTINISDTYNFNPETKELYEKLINKQDISWGFFTPHGLGENKNKIKEIEEKINYKFPVILHYQYLDMPFPLAQMEQAYEENKVVELTLQTAIYINNGAYKHNYAFEIIDGKYDHLIKKFAQDAKKFNHPFLFRLNNEMNSDWCDYTGLALLSDTDLYKEIWKKVYNIFQEENVDNAIWIFNPNDNNYPPANWNLHIAYFPGEEYVHMIGLTGYNPGDYYKSVTGERWKSFKYIYDNIASKYRKVYNGFPWIITEFASSSVGGDKENWIKEMFNNIHMYPEIKIAVWWSYADFDYTNNGVPARRYWLEEKEEYLDVFKKGLKKQADSRLSTDLR